MASVDKRLLAVDWMEEEEGGEAVTLPPTLRLLLLLRLSCSALSLPESKEGGEEGEGVMRGREGEGKDDSPSLLDG